MVEDSWSQQMLEIWKKIYNFLSTWYYTFNVLYKMDIKSIVSSLQKLHSGSDPYDDIMYKVVGWSLNVPSTHVVFYAYW